MRGGTVDTYSVVVMAARREKLRELRRQADPSFPIQASKNTPGGRPAARPQGQAPPPAHEGHQGLEVVNGQGVLKQPKSRRKKKSGKGLKVTFDLDSVVEYSDKDKDDDVVDCWEDICDFEGDSSQGSFDITEEDIIDCDNELGDIGGELLSITDHLVTGGQEAAAIDRKENTGECYVGQVERPSGNGSLPASPDDSKAEDATDVGDSGGTKGGEEAAFVGDSGDGYVGGGLTAYIPGIEESKEVSSRGIDILGFDGGDDRSIIPFIDSVEEDPAEDNPGDDDEWETEPSGGSEETVIANWCKPGEEKPGEGEVWQKVGAEDDTVADEPSLNEDYGDDSDNLITKEDIEAVFLALMEDQESDPLPQTASPVTSVNTDVGNVIEEIVSPTRLTDEAVVPVSEGRDLPRPVLGDREQSPEVSIGYECRDRKSASACGSETESDGELVPCEDKCIGTSDFLTEIGDAPLDLSVSKDTPSRDEEILGSRDECQGEHLSLAPDKHSPGVVSEERKLDSPDAKVGDVSPEVDEDVKCIGKSESAKEEKMNGKKAGKKKGKKNKRETKAEPVVKSPQIEERPKLVRGRGWREKREKFKASHGNPLNLSFGKEVCESEVVEGTSNLLVETYTEASQLTSSSCGTETTIVTETPCSTCSVASEFSESQILDCMFGENRECGVPAFAEVSEVKTRDDALEHSPTVSQMPPLVAIEVTGASSGERSDSSLSDSDDFYIVKRSTVAKPSEVLTEFVADSESSEETSQSQSADSDNTSDLTSSTENDEEFLDPAWNFYTVVERNRSNPDGDSPLSSACDSDNSAYFDAPGSSCMDTLTEPFDYVQAFPDVVGTQKLNLLPSFDDSVSSIASQSARRSNRSKDGISTEGSSPLKAIGTKGGNAGKAIEDADTCLPPKGEIIYEGPCSCGSDETFSLSFEASGSDRRDRKLGIGSEDEQLCVPPLLGDDGGGVLSDDGRRMGVETQVGDPHDSEMNSSFGSNPEDLDGEYEGNSKDIRSRINEIVGPRLQRERGRPTHAGAKEEGGGGGGPSDDHHGGREDSPLPGSSPASSSGVQGSDEMSLSRSRSRSPPREESSASPSLAAFGVPDLTYDIYHVPELSPEKSERDAAESLRALRLEGSAESSPEKMNQVDYDFRTFREMYQINPTYLTDSDEREEQNESDTVVPGSGSLSYDPDRSITVTSWASTSDDSPVPLEPLPGTHATRKVPKVSRLLRETQG